MDALGKGLWWKFPSRGRSGRHRRRRTQSSSSSSSAAGSLGVGKSGFQFPLKQAATAASLTFTGDTIAQVYARWVKHKSAPHPEGDKELLPALLSDHDWIRALRMASYGLLLYGPGSYAWYQFLDRSMPQQTLVNFSTKVILNQIVLGPCVIAAVFAWNSLWLGKLSQLPSKYQKDALPTLLYGFKFWIPVSILNFWVIPLSGRVAFMSSCAVFWNFYLSTTLSR